eukprot:PhF_6_TR1524/c0_g1_i2/m.2782/K12394/AP1S1_2; AP-1 complex subunit sigma 1/2
MIHFMLLISRQGKVRLAKWYTTFTPKDRAKAIKDVCAMVLERPGSMCNFVEWRDYKIVARRYASLFFVICIGKDDNELLALEIIHHFVEVLDKYFGNVCELDLIYNFHKAYSILDEVIIAGELQETSKKTILRFIASQDTLVEESPGNGGVLERIDT